MADAQNQDPPKLEGAAPQWFHNCWKKLVDYLMDNRVVAGLNVKILDADGRGKRIDVDIGRVSSLVKHPFRTAPTTRPVGETGEGWVKVDLHSMLMKDIHPTSKITITGLNAAFKLEVDQHVWLAVDVSALFDTPTPGDVTATVGHGDDWNTSGKNFFPSPIEWNTTDGTATGTVTGGLPRKQEKFFIPIAYTVNPESDPFSLAATEGILLTEGVSLVQQLRHHLQLFQDCYEGDDVYYAICSHAPFPTPE